jgi:hypothetical protein
LGACDSKAPSPAAKQQAGPVAVRPAAPARPQGQGQVRDDAGDNAAATLRHYYALIEKGNFEGAWDLRTASDGLDPERFAANFKAYESYRASVGRPSLPVRAGEWDYVEVPVMITGRMRGGRPFGNSGSVSLRRARSGSDRTWRIYTG